MAQQGVYFEILDWLDQQRRLDPATFLLKLQTGYLTGPVLYVEGAVAAERLRMRRLVDSRLGDTSHASRRLLERPLLDQILRVFSALEPTAIDLSPLTPTPAAAGPTARPRNATPAVGYPLLSRPGYCACLLVEAGDPEQWPDWRRRNDRDLLSLAGRFHARLAKTKPPRPRQNHRKTTLTRRERETLAWIAAGKSYWEAAVILGITERTVRFFMANARDKLDVVNNAQAVAEAAWQGLIPRLSDSPDAGTFSTHIIIP